MKWKEFLDKRQLYKKAWEMLKAESDSGIREFLDNSRLVIAYGSGMTRQIDSMDIGAGSTAVDHPDFFIESTDSVRLINLARQHKFGKDLKPALKSAIMNRLGIFNTQNLSVVENQAEIRFPVLKIGFIQQIKSSKYCDKRLTDMSEASIGVILDADPKKYEK